jgi:peptidyl-prolyl cis-trans isomerase A (cyclophilin A)
MNRALLAVIFSSALLAQTPTKSTTAAKSTGAAKTAAPAAASNGDLLNPATLNKMAPPVYRVRLTTTKGDVLIEVTRAWSPRGADRFYNLVRAGYFTDVAFFRVIPGFMAQFGISGKPDLNKAWTNANIQDDPVKQSNTRGKVSFATSGPNTRTTQLFINTGNNAQLDPQGFSPIGEVVEGMENVDKFFTGYGGSPDQGALQSQGKAYIDRSMPKVDKILTASTIAVLTPPATPAAK